MELQLPAVMEPLVVADEPPLAVVEPPQPTVIEPPVADEQPPSVVEPPVADESPPAVVEPPPPAVMELPVTDELPPSVVEPPVADEPFAELGPKTLELVADQPQVKLHDNSASRNRINCMINEQYSSQDEYFGSDSDNYMPSEAEQRVCGIPRCSQDIFLGCLHCASFVCYDHMNTSCSEHIRQAADTDAESGSETSIGNTAFEPCIPANVKAVSTYTVQGCRQLCNVLL